MLKPTNESPLPKYDSSKEGSDHQHSSRNKPYDQMSNFSQSKYQYDYPDARTQVASHIAKPAPPPEVRTKPASDGKKVSFYLSLQCELFEFMLRTVDEGNSQLSICKYVPTYDKVVDSTNTIILCMLLNQTSMLHLLLRDKEKGYMPPLPESISIGDYQSFLKNQGEVNDFVQKLKSFQDRTQYQLETVQKYLDTKTSQGKELVGVIRSTNSGVYWEEKKAQALTDLADKYYLWALDFYNKVRQRLKREYPDIFRKATLYMGKCFYSVMRDVYFDFDKSWEKKKFVTAEKLNAWMKDNESIESIVIEAISTYLSKSVTLQTTIGR